MCNGTVYCRKDFHLKRGSNPSCYASAELTEQQRSVERAVKPQIIEMFNADGDTTVVKCSSACSFEQVNLNLEQVVAIWCTTGQNHHLMKQNNTNLTDCTRVDSSAVYVG